VSRVDRQAPSGSSDAQHDYRFNDDERRTDLYAFEARYKDIFAKVGVAALTISFGEVFPVASAKRDVAPQMHNMTLDLMMVKEGPIHMRYKRATRTSLQKLG
jgi:hypothetical protein